MFNNTLSFLSSFVLSLSIFLSSISRPEKLYILSEELYSLEMGLRQILNSYKPSKFLM